MYSYDYDGLGLLITTPSGTCYLQGEEGADLYDQLEAIETDEILELVLSEYEHVCE